jgi:hypothetical protein
MNRYEDIDKQIAQLMEEKKRLEKEAIVLLEKRKMEEEAAEERAVDAEVADACNLARATHMEETGKNFAELEKAISAAAQLFEELPHLKNGSDAERWATLLCRLGTVLRELYRKKTLPISFMCKSFRVIDFEYDKMKKNPTPSFLRNKRKMGSIPCIPFSENEERIFQGGRDAFAQYATHFKKEFDDMIAVFVTINNLLDDTNRITCDVMGHNKNIFMDVVFIQDSDDYDSS